MHHLALRTQDLERLAAHYENVCMLQRLPPRPNGSVWLLAGGVIVMIERCAPGEPTVARDGMDLLAFPIASLENARAHLAAHDVAVEAETAATLYFRDPDGRRNALSCYRFDD